jgi:hypothetical protein
MTTFAELEQLTIEQTRRPEIPQITKSSIKTAVLRAHHTDFFPRDLRTQVLSYVPTGTVFYDFPDVGQSLLRLRSIKFMQSVDLGGTPTESLEYRDLDDLYDSDGCRRSSVYTLQGETLRIYPVSQTGNMAVHYFQNPNTAETQLVSWIADQYPDELAFWAASIVFARTGFLEQAEQFKQNHVQPFKEMLIASHLLGRVS